MSTVEAIYTTGVFKPLSHVDFAENPPVRLTIEPAAVDQPAWLDPLALVWGARSTDKMAV